MLDPEISSLCRGQLSPAQVGFLPEAGRLSDPGEEMDPCRRGLRIAILPVRPMSVSGLAFQFPGLILLSRGLEAQLNSTAQSNPGAESPFQWFQCTELSQLSELSLGPHGGWVFSPGRLLTFCCSTAVSRGLLSSHPHKTAQQRVLPNSQCFQRHCLLSPASSRFLSFSFW